MRQKNHQRISAKKVDHMTACQAYKILIDEREKEINETPATAKWAKVDNIVI